jgi:hypothetical protein
MMPGQEQGKGGQEEQRKGAQHEHGKGSDEGKTGQQGR